MKLYFESNWKARGIYGMVWEILARCFLAANMASMQQNYLALTNINLPFPHVAKPTLHIQLVQINYHFHERLYMVQTQTSLLQM